MRLILGVVLMLSASVYAQNQRVKENLKVHQVIKSESGELELSKGEKKEKGKSSVVRSQKIKARR